MRWFEPLRVYPETPSPHSFRPPAVQFTLPPPSATSAGFCHIGFSQALSGIVICHVSSSRMMLCFSFAAVSSAFVSDAYRRVQRDAEGLLRFVAEAPRRLMSCFFAVPVLLRRVERRVRCPKRALHTKAASAAFGVLRGGVAPPLRAFQLCTPRYFYLPLRGRCAQTNFVG